MAQVLSRGRAGRDRRERAWLARRFHQDERRKVSRPDRLRQHGQGDVLWRTGPEVARLRELPAECRAPAARRARRADDAEPAAISDRRCSARCARAMSSSTATRSTRRASSIISSRIRAPRRSSFWRTSPARSKRRSTARRSGSSSSPRRRSTGRRARGRSSISSCAMSGAPFPPFASRRRCVSIARWRSARGSPFTDAPISAGRRRVSSIHRRHHRRAEGRDADPSQHDRQLAPDPRLDRAGDPVPKAKCSSPRCRSIMCLRCR